MDTGTFSKITNYSDRTDSEHEPLKSTTFKGKRFKKNGEVTKTYLTYLKNNPNEIPQLGNKVVEPNSGKVIKPRVDKKTKKVRGNQEIVNGRLTNKPTSRFSLNFTPDYDADLRYPPIEDFNLTYESDGLYWFKIYHRGVQIGEAQRQFSGNYEDNRLDWWHIFMENSSSPFLLDGEEYTIEMYYFDNIKFSPDVLPQVYADNSEGLCILEPIKKYIESCNKDAKKTKRNIKTINNLIKDNPNGVNLETMQVKICNTMRMGINIITPTNEIIHKLRPVGNGANKVFHFVNTRDNHAEDWTAKDFFEEKEEVVIDRIKEMNKIKKELIKKNECFTYNVTKRVQGLENVNIIDTKHIRYRLVDPIAELTKSFFEEQENNIQRMIIPSSEYEGSIADFIESATYVNGLRTFSEYDGITNLQEHDIEKAYATFHTCQYYAQYGIPSIPTDFRECVGQDVELVISKTGWTQICNISGSGNAFDLAGLQEYGVYPNVELKCLWDLGTTFDVLKSAWCLKKVDFRFDTKYLEGCKHKDFKSLKPYAVIVGNMLSSKTHRRFYYHYDKKPSQDWINNLVHYDQAIEMIYDNTELNDMIFKQKKPIVSSLCHVGSYITAYVRTRMYQEVEKRDSRDIVMINSDAIKFIGTYELPPGFKDKSEDIWLTDNNFRQYHNDKIKDKQFYADPWADLGQFVFYNGPGGSGKTHGFLNQHYPFKALTFPTNELKASKQGKYNCYTHHNFFKLELKKHVECFGLADYKYRQLGEVLVDEITMRTKKEIDHMIAHAKEYGYRLIFAGDIDQATKIPYQLLPVKSTFDIDLTDFQVINFTKNYRIKDPELKARIDKVRDIMHEAMQTGNANVDTEILQLFGDRLISEKQMYKDFDPKHDLIITGTNKKRSEYNKKLDAKHEKKIWRITHKVDKYEAGTILYEDDLKVTTSCKQLCFATSIHKVQGKTWEEGKLYINPKDVFELGHLYTALSRVRHLEQIEIIH